MKKIISSLVLIFAFLSSYAQLPAYVRGDTIILTNKNKSAVVRLEIGSKNKLQFLKNTGNGRVEFDTVRIADIPTLESRLTGLGGAFWKLSGTSVITANTVIQSMFSVRLGNPSGTNLLINNANNEIDLNGGDGARIRAFGPNASLSYISGGSFTGLEAYNGGLLFTDDAANIGPINAGDYESNFVARSLITKQYGDAQYAPITGGGYVPINGNTTVNGLKNFSAQLGAYSFSAYDPGGFLDAGGGSFSNVIIGSTINDRRRTMRFYTGSVKGFEIGEGQSQNFVIYRPDGSGGILDSPMVVSKATGGIAFGNSYSGSMASKFTFTDNNASAIIGVTATQSKSATGYSANDYYDNTGAIKLTWGYANSGASFQAGNAYVNTSNSAQLVFAYNSVEKFRILSTGGLFTQNNIATTSTPGVAIVNSQAATSGVPIQYGPRLRFGGAGYNNTTAASNSQDAAIELQPTTGATTGAILAYNFQNNGGGYTNQFNMASSGVFTASSRVGVNVSTVAGVGASIHVGNLANFSTTQNFGFQGFGIRQESLGYTSTTSTGTVAFAALNTFAVPTFNASSATIITDAATWYIGGSPVAGTNMTINNMWGVYVIGNGYFNNNFVVAGRYTSNNGSASAASQFNIGNTNAFATNNTFSTAGFGFNIQPNTYTSTTSTGTIANMGVYTYGTSNLAASNATTLTNAASLYINAAPVAGTNVTITNAWAFNVNGGNSRFGGSINLPSLTASTALALNSSNNIVSATTTLVELNFVSGVTSAIQTQINSKQASLVSGTNIKTVNGTTLLGSGNLAVGDAVLAANQTFTGVNTLTSNSATNGLVAINTNTSGNGPVFGGRNTSGYSATFQDAVGNTAATIFNRSSGGGDLVVLGGISVQSTTAGAPISLVSNASATGNGLHIFAGDPTHQSFQIMNYNSTTTAMKVFGDGKTEIASSLKTGAPSGDTAQPWKLGSASSGTMLPAADIIAVEINGTTYYIPTVTP